MNVNNGIEVAPMQTSSTTQPSSLLPMLIIGSLFFVFGFVTWLNGALIPFLQIVCQLNDIQALLIAFSFYIAYVVMALPMAWVLERTGYRLGMVIGLCLIALGCLAFIPAALEQTFLIFLLAQFMVGSGLTILQTASNPYIVKVGPEESAAVRISIMGLLNKGAGVIAPIVFTALVLGDFAGISAKSVAAMPALEQKHHIEMLAHSLIGPYLGMAIALFLLAFGLAKSGLPELSLAHEQETANGSIMQFPHLLLGVATLFCYVGVEVIAGDTIGLLGAQLELENATALTSYTMVFMVIGYLAGLVLIPRFISQSVALAGCAISGLVLSLLVVSSNPGSYLVADILWGWTGITTVPDTVAWVALLGLANALVWPAVWPLALAELGKYTSKGSALLIMGIAGGAILPLLFGALSEHSGIQQAYWMMLPCYAFILFYALKGHKLRAK